MTPGRFHRQRRARLGAAPWLLAIAAILCFLALWIVVPAPTSWLLPLGVGAPEVSPWLAIASAAVCVCAAWVGRRARTGRVAIGLSAAAQLFAAWPLARVPSTVRRFDHAMAAALGDDYVGRLPTDIVSRLRPKPLIVADFVRGIDAGRSRSVRGVEFARHAGTPLTLDVHRPLTTGSFPIVVQIYGGSWQRGAPGDDGLVARALAGKGYVVFAIDYRHAPRWQWPAQMEDVRAALAWIGVHAVDFDGDVTRMALLGRSAGAQLALVAAYERRTPGVRAVISYYGPVDLAEGWRHPPSPDPIGVRSILEAYLGGPPSQRGDAYRQASPIAYATKDAPPTLLIYGTRDHAVEARFGRALDAQLRSAGATSVLLEIPWAEHAFDAIPNGLSGQLSLYYTERFLARTLYGDSNAAP